METRLLGGPHLPTALARLAAAWERLAKTRALTAEVFADALLVLVSSVPGADGPARSAASLDPPPLPPGPTAAHPRAFRGTKYRPPKESQRAPGDLRPLLCSRDATRALLTARWASRGPSLNRLRRLDLDRAGLSRLGNCVSPPADPYLAFHHPGAPPRATLPPQFVARLLPALTGATWNVVRRAAALHQRLNLAADERLSWLTARLLSVSPGNTLALLEILETQPRDRWQEFLVLALESGSLEGTRHLPLPVAVELGHAPSGVSAPWVQATFDALRRGVNPKYLGAGLHFATQYAPDKIFIKVGDAPDFDERTARQLERLLPVEWTGRELMHLWETCASVPGFSTYVRDCDWGRFTSAERRYVLAFFMSMRGDTFDRERWRAIAAHLPRLESRLLEVPAGYAEQYLSDLGTILSAMRGSDEIEERLPLGIDLVARLNRPPFNPNGNIAASLGVLLRLPPGDRRRVLAAADASFLVLDKGCRRENAALLVAWGLSSLVSRMPELVGQAFGETAGPLIRTARHLGVLSRAARSQLLSHCSRRAVFRASLERGALAGLVDTIEATKVAQAVAIIPRAVRDHLLGRRHLSPAQLQRHENTVRRGLPACRLAVVRAAVDEQLSRSVGSRGAESQLLSALSLLQDAGANRRGLRRALRALVNGNTEHLRRHPETQDWSRRHPRIDLDLWTRGLERSLHSGGRALTLRLEQDPLEVLKMGTYVGSCLGLGGGLSYSAAAVLLDVNKQVLYARDAHGTVVARQLLALSDDERLVAFAVYPRSAARALQQAFDQYDTDFATALGVARVSRGSDYDIENVLSQDWWDDGAWDPDDATDGEDKPGRL